jgi:tetratricopeptide (TPR) repeat protein
MKLRRCVLAVAAALTLAGAAAATTTPAEPTHEIKDPHYGDTLFHFFQDHYFTAITTLMVAQHFDLVSHHADEAEVLRGGMLLSYGLQREAGEIFEHLIERGATPSVRDRAWYYLAKIAYQRGYLEQAQSAIDRIQNALPPALQEDRVLLQANVLMARADYAAAAKLLETVDSKASSARFANYNLGVALIKSGDMARGTEVLSKLGQATAEDEESRSLRDRSNVALGFAALSDKHPDAAQVYLERVRLQGPQASKALLGLGWAHAALDQPRLALIPWTELAQRSNDAAALEAQIALPYAWAQLGEYAQALARYQAAIGTFERESVALDESIAAIRSGTLVDALVSRNPAEEMGWFWTLRELPAVPHPSHLLQVLAQNEFQEALKNYRDLRFLARNLEAWRDKLGVFSDMLDARRKAFADRLPSVQTEVNRAAIAALGQRRETVAAEFSRGVDASDPTVFASASQLDLLQRVASVQAAVAGSDPELVPYRERVRLASGALTWQLAQDFPDRVWSTQKELEAVDAQLIQARQRDAALTLAQREQPARFDAFARRIAAIDPLLQTLTTSVAALSKEQQEAVQDMAVAELLQQKERLAAYAAQARFAVAQMYDRASTQPEAPHDAPQ